VRPHGLDFGKKAHRNLVELTRPGSTSVPRPRGPRGRLVVHAKSAHVYEPDWALTADLTAAFERTRVDARRSSFPVRPL
jgi:hypothetical protein